MIVDSMILTQSGIYTVDATDCDPYTPGNQGFLPITILSKGIVSAVAGATINISGDHEHGGPGGAGGGGACEDSPPTELGPNTSGGDGFTGGEGATIVGGEGSGSSGIIV